MEKRRIERVYISGPMSGLTREAYERAFSEAERLLRESGYSRIMNPSRFLVSRCDWLYRLLGYEQTLLYDLWRMRRCHRIYMLPGWRESTGARIESFVACNLGIHRLPPCVREKLDSQMEAYLKRESRKANK